MSSYQTIPVILALTLGVLFSLFKFMLLESVLKYLGAKGNKRFAVIANLMIYSFSLVILAGMVIIAMRFGIPILIAALVGSLSIIIIICINAITEAIGITKNQFGQKVK